MSFSSLEAVKEMIPTCSMSSNCHCGRTGCPMSSGTSDKTNSFTYEIVDYTVRPANRHERRKQIAEAIKRNKKTPSARG